MLQPDSKQCQISVRVIDKSQESSFQPKHQSGNYIFRNWGVEPVLDFDQPLPANSELKQSMPLADPRQTGRFQIDDWGDYDVSKSPKDF